MLSYQIVLQSSVVRRESLFERVGRGEELGGRGLKKLGKEFDKFGKGMGAKEEGLGRKVSRAVSVQQVFRLNLKYSREKLSKFVEEEFRNLSNPSS
jgi:hypothetical protein